MVGTLWRVIYTSKATPLPPGQDEAALIDAILATARRRNAQAGLTGALIYADGRFAQLLEGSPEALEEVLSRLSRDPRHTEMETLEAVEEATRVFTAWTMAFGSDLDMLPDELAEAGGNIAQLIRLRAVVRDGRLPAAA